MDILTVSTTGDEIEPMEAEPESDGREDRPPRDRIVRAMLPGPGYARDAEDQPPTLFGHFAVFDEWTEIDSMFEGHFMERIAPGAFAKTFRENGNGIRVLFQHGRDPVMGDKPIGKPDVLQEDERGAYYEVQMFDGVDPLIVNGLRAGQYGASFAFRVTREGMDRNPEPSGHNPNGLAERTIREVELYEFGPVTFPAYAGATAGMRSLTDEMIFGRFVTEPVRLARMVKHAEALLNRQEAAPSTPDAGPEPTSGQERRTPLPVRRRRISYLEKVEEPWKL